MRGWEGLGWVGGRKGGGASQEVPGCPTILIEGITYDCFCVDL